MGRNGTGVKAATENSIQIDFVYKGIRCRERIKRKPTPANLKLVERHREAILHAINNDSFDYAVTFPNSKLLYKFIEPSELTVRSWVSQWLHKKTPHLKLSTLNGYEKCIKVIIDQFGHIKLSELKRKEVRAWCESLTVSNKTIANRVSILRAALHDACSDELIESNVLSDFTFKRNEPPKVSDVDPFNQEEQEAICNALTGHMQNLIKFAFWTGLRTSELVALEWRDVDWERETVHVRRAKTQYARVAETTKTKAGTREVRLLQPAKEALLAQKELTCKEGKQIFLNPYTETSWLGDQAIRKAWVIALRKAGVRYRRPYQTRHTYASMMLSAGENLAWVSKQLGHSSVIMTASVYATWIPNSQPEAGNKAVDLFS